MRIICGYKGIPLRGMADKGSNGSVGGYAPARYDIWVLPFKPESHIIFKHM